MIEGNITTLTIEHHLGAVVYFRLDVDQIPFFVIGVLLTHGAVRYLCNSAAGEQWFYAFEITSQKHFGSFN